MPIKSSKNNNLAVILLILTIFTFTGCNNLDVVPKETDFFKETMAGKGNTLDVESITLSERLSKMLSNGPDLNLKTGLTFEVALSQFSVMPLLSVDRVGGIIITDWYSSGSNPNERVKFNIIIKDEMMEEGSIDINMFKEKFDGTNWKQSNVNNETSNKIKKIILTKAKKLQATAELS